MRQGLVFFSRTSFRQRSRRHAKRYTETDPAKRMVVFPLSYLVDKCYKYSPLVTLGKCYVTKTIDKKKCNLPFQVLCFPHGYKEDIMGRHIQNNYLPQRKILCRYSGGDNFVVAKSFLQAVVSFMSEPLLSDEEIAGLEEKGLPNNAGVVSSLAINSSIWVVGPFIPSNGYGERRDDQLYYRIAAGVLYRSTPEGTYIDFIRSVNTSTSTILSVPWDISLLRFPNRNERPEMEKDKSINSRRLGVFLFCVIQGLCKHKESNISLFLQCEHTKHSFSRLITIGFWYSRKHYVFYSLRPQESNRPFPFCSGFAELPFALSTLAGKGEICYKRVHETENEAIRLLMLKNSLATWFPPLTPLTDHPLLTKWLFSVPFPLPYSYHPWTTSVLKKIRKFFPKDCCQEDDRWSPDNFSSLAPLQT